MSTTRYWRHCARATGELAADRLRRHVGSGSEVMLASIMRREEQVGRDNAGPEVGHRVLP